MSDKMQELCDIEGVADEIEYLEEFGHDTIAPGICTNPSCDYTISVEQDCGNGWCGLCKTFTVKSGIMILGII